MAAPRPLFTRVRGTEILGSSDAGCCIDSPNTPIPSPDVHGAGLTPTCITRPCITLHACALKRPPGRTGERRPLRYQLYNVVAEGRRQGASNALSGRPDRARSAHRGDDNTVRYSMAVGEDLILHHQGRWDRSRRGQKTTPWTSAKKRDRGGVEGRTRNGIARNPGPCVGRRALGPVRGGKEGPVPA
jgi:hypothetical protein